MATKTLDVTITVEVTIDETKFTSKFMEEFNRHFFQADIDEHFKNIAHGEAMGLISGFGENRFLEGYGKLSDMGISTVVVDEEVEPAVGY